MSAGKVDAPFTNGAWVAERKVQFPEFGKVRDAYWDSVAKEWVADIVLYDAGGNRIGRSSLAMGGPTSFEPCVPCANWQQIRKPIFPLEREPGSRCWRKSLVKVKQEEVK